MRKIIEVIGDVVLEYAVFIAIIGFAVAYMATSGTFKTIMDTVMTNLQGKVI